MMAHAVTHRLDEDGLAPARERHRPRKPHHLPHGKDVVPVHAHRVDAVADAAAGDPVAPVLVQCWRADRVPVVAADEDDGAGARRGDVQRGVEVAFAGGAFAEVAGDDAGGEGRVAEALQFEGVGGARGLGDLGCQGGGDGVLGAS